MGRFYLTICSMNEWMGRIVGWLFIPLIFVVTYEVTVRYVFNNPTTWAWDITGQLLLVIVVGGGGYALLHNNHVTIDVLSNKLQTRGKALCEAIMGLLLIGSVGLLLWRVSLDGWHSVITRENYSSPFAPPIYPAKVLMIIGIGAMFLQGIANWLRNILILIKGYGNGH